jgi:cytochrome c peroxidase
MKGEDSSQLLAYASPWNSKSQSIFAADFLNPYFFTRLTKEEDSKELHDLGKSLFYDPVLSNDNGMSCASCHNPDKGFTDAQPKSLSSVQGKTVLRNAPTLLNAVYADRYFYDLRAYTLEQQAEHVIFNPSEFNTAYSSILKKLNNNPEYAKKFKSVFGSGDINRENFSKALASYVLSLSSFNSEFDKYVRGEDTKMSDEAKRGFNLFMGKAACATCHFAPTFAGLVPPFYNENESEILGVMQNPKDPSSKIDEDSGRLTNGIGIEQAWIYEKSFKTSTVRNAGITAPYFHNGAYTTLEEVIEFYNLGGGEGMGRTVKNQTLAPDVLNLTPAEQKDLIAFIKTLTDDSVTKK